MEQGPYCVIFVCDFLFISTEVVSLSHRIVTDHILIYFMGSPFELHKTKLLLEYYQVLHGLIVLHVFIKHVCLPTRISG